jgi:hypothetical protein
MKLESIKFITPKSDYSLDVIFEEGVRGTMDMKQYLTDEAFEPLNNISEFMKIHNGGYLIKWECGADLSADTIRQKLMVKNMGKAV